MDDPTAIAWVRMVVDVVAGIALGYIAAMTDEHFGIGNTIQRFKVS